MKKCPKCQQAKKVHRSHRDAPLWLQLLGWHRFRCTQCNLYFEGWRLFPARRNGSSSTKESEEPQVNPVPKSEAVPLDKAVAETADNGSGVSRGGDIHCPNCQSHRIRRAKREGLMEEMLYPLISKDPYKCSECGTRFLKKGRS